MSSVGNCTDNSTSCTNVINNTCFADVSEQQFTAVIVGMAIITTTGIISNILGVIALKIAIVEYRPVHYFLANLSTVDILICVSITCKTMASYCWQGKHVDVSIKAVFIIMKSSSLLGQAGCLLTLALDHYCAIVHPLRYQLLLDKKRCYFLIGMLWLVTISMPAFYTVCSHTNESMCEAMEVAILVSYGFVFLLMIILYGWILKETWNMSKSGTQQTGLNKKAIKTTFMIVGTYFLFIGPKWMAAIIDSPSQPIMNVILECWLLMNCIFDPLIYSLRMHDVRKGYTKIWSACTPKPIQRTPARQSSVYPL